MSNTQKAKQPAAQKASEPAQFDLDTLEAERRHETFTFTFGGREFTLPHMRDIDRKLMRQVDEGSHWAAEEALKIGLGEQYDAFEELPLSLFGLNELFKAWLEHSGMREGESQASTGS